MFSPANEYPPLPSDNPGRALTLSNPEGPAKHIGLVGDTYTVTVSGEDTGGRFCVIDMHVPPGGGPGAHRHDFDETFVLLEGQVELTFRGSKLTARTGDTVSIPSNAPHLFRNASSVPARMLCICSPAGIDDFFAEVGVPVATRTTLPPALDEKQMLEFLTKARALAPRYRIELLKEA